MNRACVVFAVIVLVLPLSGCLADQRDGIAQCRKATKSFAAVAPCMESKGYVFDARRNCPGLGSPDLHGRCYRSRNWFAARAMDVEVLFAPPPRPPLTPLP